MTFNQQQLAIQSPFQKNKGQISIKIPKIYSQR